MTQTPYFEEYISNKRIETQITPNSKWRWMGAHTAFILRVTDGIVYYKMGTASFTQEVDTKQFINQVNIGNLSLIPE